MFNLELNIPKISKQSVRLSGLAVGLVLATGIGYFQITEGNESFVCGRDVVTDIDGHEYRTVAIGEQCWMAENLQVTHYRDSTPIPRIEDHNDWWDDTEGALALYDHNFPFRYPAGQEINSDQEMLEIFGLLYNFYAVDHPAGLCPADWRVPSDKDWQELEMALGMSHSQSQNNWYRGSNEGSQLSARAELWDDNSITGEGFQASGFGALPAGYRRSYGDYGNLNANANFWTSDPAGSEPDEPNAISREIYAGNQVIYRITNINKNNGHSVRCLKAD